MIQKLITFVIEKATLIHIFFLFLIVLGTFSYIKIPKEIFPPVNLDAISISGSYSGASPDILDKMAVTNIEDELRSFSDISKIESTIKNSFFFIKATLKENSNLPDTLDDVKDVLSNLKRDLPADMNEPVAKRVKNSFPLVTIAIAAKVSKERLIEVADKLKRELSLMKDLSDIQIRGYADKELLITLDHQKIMAYGLEQSAIVSAISSLSNIFPVGFIKERGNHLFLSTYNGFKEINRLHNVILKTGGKRIRLGDIADIRFTLADASEISHFNALPNISVNVNKAKTGNAIALVKEIRSILKTYKDRYPEFTFDIYTDTSIWIRNRLNTVISNILFGLILVSLSIFIFVNARISFVVAIGIPTSFLIGLIATDLLGYSINMLSLLGALIALGMLVDEAIVVAENIQRHIENGDDPKTAAINGAAEMFPAVLTATATTIFAFLPLLIMSGEMGVFIKILPIMISILLLSSLFEAFFFLPLHAKEILKPGSQNPRTEKLWQWLQKNYQTTLTFLLKHTRINLILFVLVILGLTAWMLSNSKFQLFPTFDTTQIYVSGEVNKNFSLEETEKLVAKVEKILLEKLDKNEIDSVTSVSGMKLDNKFKPKVGENLFHIFINLHERKPRGFYNSVINPLLSPEYDNSDMTRIHSAQEIGKEISKITKIFETEPEFEEFSVVVPGAGIVESDVDIALSGEESKVHEALQELETKLHQIKGVFNIHTDLIAGEKEIKFKLNSYGESLGFNEAVISQILRPLFLKAEIGKMFYEGKLTRIKSEDIGKDKSETLHKLLVSIPGSLQKVKLSDIVEFQIIHSPATIHKENGIKINSLFASLEKETIKSSEVMRQIKPLLNEFERRGIKVIIKGEEQENQKVQTEMTEAAIIALFLIFIALIWMFGKISLSLYVLSTIPLSVFGVLIGHIVMHMDLTMPGMLGIVGLAGVVVNDGIIMIDFIRKARNKEEFITLASLRLRPILLTSMTTVLGLSTLIFFAQGQAVILQPMAISLGFGITWATVLNLLFLPILYASMKKI